MTISTNPSISGVGQTGAGGGSVNTVNSISPDGGGNVSLGAADIPRSAPVSITNTTTLTAAAHANRQLIYSGANATLTISADATGGWATDDTIEIHTATASAGVPTLATPDGKSITGSATKIIGATRKGTDSWTVGTTDPATSAGGGSMPNIFDGGSMLAVPLARGTTFSVIGSAVMNSSGTATARTTSLNGHGFLQRIGYVSAATANSASFVTQTGGNEVSVAPGTDPATPTFRVRMNFCVTDALTACRTFAGAGPNVPSAANPSTVLNLMGFGADDTDTQLTFMTNNGTTTTKTVLNGGTGFPANTNGVDIYEAYCELVPGATRTANYFIKNRVTGVVAQGSVTATLPTAGVAMRPFVVRNNSANAAAVTIDVGAIATGGFAQMGASS
jgi:hypothetical protein